MASRSFGSGLLIATGSNGPVQFGVLQDVTLDLKGTTKKLYGQNQFPVDIGRGELSLTGKAKIGQIHGAIYSDLFFGAVASSGTTKLAYNELGTIPSATTYTVTVTNSTTFVADQGVVYADTGLPLKQVAAGSEAAGSYSVSAGVYTFSAADSGKSVLVSYTYTDATNGQTIALGNPLQGVQPTFSIIVSRESNGTGERLKVHKAISSSLQLPTKMADFAISEFDFEGFADASGNTLTRYGDD